jgi:hypothetical protein
MRLQQGRPPCEVRRRCWRRRARLGSIWRTLRGRRASQHRRLYIAVHNTTAPLASGSYISGTYIPCLSVIRTKSLFRLPCKARVSSTTVDGYSAIRIYIEKSACNNVFWMGVTYHLYSQDCEHCSLRYEVSIGVSSLICGRMAYMTRHVRSSPVFAVNC